MRGLQAGYGRISETQRRKNERNFLWSREDTEIQPGRRYFAFYLHEFGLRKVTIFLPITD